MESKITLTPIIRTLRYINVISTFANSDASLKYKIEESKITLLIVDANALYIRIRMNKNVAITNILATLLFNLVITICGRTINTLTLIIKITNTVKKSSIGDFANPRINGEEKYIGLINSWKPIELPIFNIEKTIRMSTKKKLICINLNNRFSL